MPRSQSSFLPAGFLAADRQSVGGSVRLRTLIFVRSLGIIGQMVAVVIVFFGLKYQMPIGQCLMVIGVAIAFNVAMFFLYPSIHILSEREATAHLAFDILQLTAMLALTGGIQNPFGLLYLAPIVISAANLSLASTLVLAFLAFCSISIISFFHWQLPWDPADPLLLPPLYVAGNWISLTLGIGFCLIYAWRTADEARRMQTALAATQATLEREQRLSDLGALAAAAAHELGTPLGTIAIVARELERDIPQTSPWAEDIHLLRSQAERCREILSRLAQQDTGESTVAQRLPLAALIDEIAEPHRGFGVEIEARMKGPGTLTVVRSPEVAHGLGNLIENAADFAQTKVEIEAAWDDDNVFIAIADDGTGFDPEILARLGEPYVTSRPALEQLGEANDGHAGLGLGFFIAKTLIERTGGKVTFANKPGGGALVRVVFPRASLEKRSISRG